MRSLAAPTVSVIICHHVGKLIDRCLTSLTATQGVTFEVCVVTSDPTYHAPEGVMHLWHTGGPAAKRNYGASCARGTYLVFLDDDVEVAADTLFELVDGLVQRPQAAMGFAKILNMVHRDVFDDCGSWLTPTGFLWARAGNDQKDMGQYDTPERCLASKSATCVIRKTVFQRVGEFDEDYYILGEETDLAWRCWLRGYEVWYLPGAMSWHAFGTDLKPKADYYTLERIHTYGCRNYLSLLWTHLGALRASLLIPPHLCAWLVAALGFAFRGELRRSGAIMRGVCQFARRLPALQRKRQAIQRTRRLSDRALWPRIARTPPLTYYTARLLRYTRQGLHG